MTMKLNERIAQMQAGYEAEREFFKGLKHCFPSRSNVIELVEDIKHLMFPGYLDKKSAAGLADNDLTGERLLHIERLLRAEIQRAFMFAEGEALSADDAQKRAAEACDKFMDSLPQVQAMLLKDIQAAFDGDPAADSKEEILLCYPGFNAILVHRIAHELYKLDVPLIPRLMSEHVHQETGVDIGPGAVIGEYFFIDHATGVVIGETTEIGNHVKIYQGVTLGAKSTRKGQLLANVKRHPTIEDDVTIYSNASVLGGDVVIGKGSIIGGSAFVLESVPAGSRVSLKNQEVTVRSPEDAS